MVEEAILVTCRHICATFSLKNSDFIEFYKTTFPHYNDIANREAYMCSVILWQNAFESVFYPQMHICMNFFGHEYARHCLPDIVHKHLLRVNLNMLGTFFLINSG